MKLSLIRNKPNLIFNGSEGEMKGMTPFFMIMMILGYYVGYRLYQNYSERIYKNKALRKNLMSNIRFNDIYGLDQAKQELGEIIDYLKNPSRYFSTGLS